MKKICKLNRETQDADMGARLPVSEQVLLWLLQHPYQRLEDIALAIRMHPSSICRSLAPLLQQCLVGQVTPTLGQTSRRVFYYLTKQGVDVVADLLGESPEALIRVWQIDEKRLLRLLPRFHTLIQVQNLINSLVVHALGVLNDPEEGKATIRWRWMRSYQQTFTSKGKQFSCQCDAALVFACSPLSSSSHVLPPQEQPEEKYYSAFILADPGLVGNEDLRLIQARLEAFLRWRESPQWGAYYRQFPALLVLASEERSREVWHWCAREAAAHLRLAPLKGAVLAYTNEASWPSGWYLPWQQLGATGPCRLRDLFVPVSLEAVPPGLLTSRATSKWRGALKRQEQTPKMLIKGGFAQRTEKQRGLFPKQGHDEREAVMLLGLQAHRRHLEILLQVYAHPLLNKEELALFLQMEIATMTRYLSDLKQMSCIQAEETTCGQRLLLSHRGLRLIAAVLNVSLQHLCEIRREENISLAQRGVTYMLRTIKHTAGIYRFLAQMQQAARDHHHELAWWETGARCARRYHYQGNWYNLRPDAFFEYRTDDRIIRAWLEWDEGTMNRRDLEAKMRVYAQFVRAGQWRKEGPVLPMLVMVVPEKGQELRMQQVVTEILGETRMVVCSTTATRLEEHGPLGEIWLPVLPQPEQRQAEYVLVRQSLGDMHSVGAAGIKD